MLPGDCPDALPQGYERIPAETGTIPSLLPVLPERGDLPGPLLFPPCQKELSPESGSFMLEEDSVMSTGYDLLAARLIAAEMLLGYLNRKVLLAMEGAYAVQEKEHHWTDRKAAAVELIYGIWAMGSVDNGRVSIVELVMLFEQMFHIDLGDVYHTFISMRNRKNSRTAYLDQMKERLLKRMDETDG